MNEPQALYVNPGCLKCTSDIKLTSPANKNLLIVAFIL